MDGLTYMYCLVRSARRPSLRSEPEPVPGADGVHLLDAGDGLWIVASHVPAREYDEAALARGLQRLEWVAARAMAHEGVVEQFLRARAILPMQLFTLFTSDARALAHVASNRRAIDRAMARIERQHEWGVRLTLAERAAPAGASAGKSPARTRALETGAAYLSRKRDLVHHDRRRLEDARVEGNRVYRAMAREATASRRRSDVEQGPPGSRVVVDAAFLVPVDRTAAFRAAARRHARRLQGTGLGLSVTGPWPPYNFIDAPRRRPS